MTSVESIGSRFLIGSFGGIVGTLFHTAVMAAGHAYAPRARQEPTPPRQITASAIKHVAPRAAPSEAEIALGTALLHVGYGAVAGAFYPPLLARRHERPVARGTAYGVSVWAASYLGWLPAVGMPPPATRQPPQQNLAMVLAHVAWGAALGATVAWAYHRGGVHAQGRREFVTHQTVH